MSEGKPPTHALLDRAAIANLAQDWHLRGPAALLDHPGIRAVIAWRAEAEGREASAYEAALTAPLTPREERYSRANALYARLDSLCAGALPPAAAAQISRMAQDAATRTPAADPAA